MNQQQTLTAPNGKTAKDAFAFFKAGSENPPTIKEFQAMWSPLNDSEKIELLMGLP